MFRYIRVLANSAFARHVSGNVTMAEIFLSLCGLKGQPFDLGSNVAKHLGRAYKKRGEILLVGGFMMPIANYFQSPLLHAAAVRRFPIAKQGVDMGDHLGRAVQLDYEL